MSDGELHISANISNLNWIYLDLLHLKKIILIKLLYFCLTWMASILLKTAGGI